MLKICGPKYALCCTILSIWGIIQLSIMGGFFYTYSVALVEDLGVDDDLLHKQNGTQLYLEAVDKSYETQAYKCWVAVAIYILTLLFSLCQMYVNKKQSYQT